MKFSRLQSLLRFHLQKFRNVLLTTSEVRSQGSHFCIRHLLAPAQPNFDRRCTRRDQMARKSSRLSLKNSLPRSRRIRAWKHTLTSTLTERACSIFACLQAKGRLMKSQPFLFQMHLESD